jgi:hypothetical protein
MEEKPTCPMCRENIRPTTGQLRPRSQAAAAVRALQRREAEAVIAADAVSAAAQYGAHFWAYQREQAEAVIAADEAVLATERRARASAAPLPSHMIVVLGTFINENPNNWQRLGIWTNYPILDHDDVHYINSENELDDLLISVRNAPIDIRFTSNYWEG